MYNMLAIYNYSSNTFILRKHVLNIYARAIPLRTCRVRRQYNHVTYFQGEPHKSVAYMPYDHTIILNRKTD